MFDAFKFSSASILSKASRALHMVLFDVEYPLDQLIDQTNKIIDLFAPKLILGISDEISSTGDIERVKIVGNIVEEYNK